MTAFNIDDIRAQFPILSREINGQPVAYLDNAASAQKPKAVIDAMTHQMSHSFANVHRGLHTMANETTEAYEGARAKVAKFLGAPKPSNIVFTKGASGRSTLPLMVLRARLKQGMKSSSRKWNIIPISCRGISCASVMAL